MSTNVGRGAATRGASSPSSLFAACCFALVVSAVAFGIRSDIAGDLAKHFNTTKEAVGWFGMGGAFWGFAISIFIGGQLCDWLGMKALLLVACLMQLAGVALTVFAPSLAILGIATWSIGIGNGLVEAVINPMVATMYPNEKTRRLNLLHVWWPGGIVIGGLAGYFLGSHVSWQIKQSIVFIPAVIYGILFLGLKVPPTERVQSGVSAGAMYKELLRPLFIVFLFCMILTAATELGPGQWMGTIMTKTAGSGILVLVWISLIMAVARLFAGPVVHRISPTGMLLCCAVVSIIGLLLMSKATSVTGAFVAATVFAIGVCYFWPTMLGFTSERFPAGGALLMGLIGTAGMASAGFAQPVMGSLLDKFKDNPAASLQYAAFLPAILVVIFGIVYLNDRAKGGYKAERLSARAEEAAAMADGEA